MHPKNQLVRVVNWQFKKLAWYFLIPPSLIAVLGIVAQFIGPFFFAQEPDLPLPFHVRVEPKLLQPFTYDQPQHLRVIVKELRSINSKLDKIVDSNATSADLSLIEGNLTLIAKELQDLNCAVHKCEDFSDEPDPAANILEVLDILSDFENVTGDLENLKTSLIHDDDCLHPYGAAILSSNVYHSCIYADNSFRERDVNFCTADECYTADWALSNGVFYSHYCLDELVFAKDLVAYQPAYYFADYVERYEPEYPFEYLLKLSGGTTFVTTYYIFTIESNRCYLAKNGVVAFSESCSPDGSAIGSYLPLPQEVERSESRCVKYNSEVLEFDYWDCALETAVDAEVRLLSHMLNGKSYFPNATFNIRDQNLIIPSINYVFDSYTDATFPYIREVGKVNISYPIDTEISFPTPSLCMYRN